MLACSGWLLVGCYGVLGGCHVHAGVLGTVSMTGVFRVVVRCLHAGSGWLSGHSRW